MSPTLFSVASAPRRFGFAPIQKLGEAVHLLIDNPIISRELKVRVRFARAFWLQGAYLVFLIVIISLAYQGIIAQQPLSNPAALQSRLQGFYYTMLYSLIGIVVLIAPALTSGAISFERERRTLDLLLASPLTPGGIMTGKLIASFAFLLLLLILSMPVTTVCILFGGATVGDLLATYALIAFDALHLCALALYCSTVSNASGTATFRAYLSALGLLLITLPVLWLNVASLFMPYGGHTATVPFPLGSLHPFAAPMIKAMPAEFFGLNIPCWLVCGVFSLLLTRLWLTGAAARLGAEGNPTGSLRRQGMLLTVLALLSSNALWSSVLTYLPYSSMGATGSVPYLWVLSGLGCLAAGISAFIPWIATFGEHEGRPPADDGWFNPGRMFRPVASGALPFLLTWFGITSGAFLCCAILRVPSSSPGLAPSSDWMSFFLCAGYYVLLLTLLWSAGRFWSVVTGHLKQARGLTIGTFLVLLGPPGIAIFGESIFFPIHTGYGSTATPSEVTQDLCTRGFVIGLMTVLLLVISKAIARHRAMRATRMVVGETLVPLNK